ncbi:MAG: hypothetical protein M1837_004466 [Sclerophora amabilis]|nr:MAG: hypothetical protein M1837_004466 [Sclerophora amabilis]
MKATMTPRAAKMAGAIFGGDGVAVSMAHLSSQDIESLTNIFTINVSSENTHGDRQQGSEDTLAERQEAVTGLIEHLPKHLKAPVKWQGRIVGFLAKSIDIREAAPLCKTHKSLNAQLIRSIFAAHMAEVGLRLNDLIAFPDGLTFALQGLVARLRAMHALWIPPDTYRDWFFKAPDDRWTFQHDGCEACMLARMGSDPATVLDLRISAWSRWKKGRDPPRLYRWTDQLVERTGRLDDLESRCARDAKALRKARHAAQRAKRGGTSPKKRRRKPKNCNDQSHSSPCCPHSTTSSSSGSSACCPHSTTSSSNSSACCPRSSTTASGSSSSSSSGSRAIRDSSESDDHTLDDGNSDSEFFEERIIDYYAALRSTATLAPPPAPQAPPPASAPPPDSALYPPHRAAAAAAAAAARAAFTTNTALVIDGLVHPAARPASSVYPSTPRGSTCFSASKVVVGGFPGPGPGPGPGPRTPTSAAAPGAGAADAAGQGSRCASTTRASDYQDLIGNAVVRLTDELSRQGTAGHQDSRRNIRGANHGGQVGHWSLRHVDEADEGKLCNGLSRFRDEKRDADARALWYRGARSDWRTTTGMRGDAEIKVR